LAFVDHVNKFLMKKVDVLKGRAVRALLEGALELLASPWWHCKLDRGTLMRIRAQEGSCWVRKIFQGQEVAGWTELVHKTTPIQLFKCRCIKND
jgi:hypothetical protein